MTAPATGPLRPFFDDEGRLRQWPVKFSYQKLALAWLVSAFEPGRRYTEKEVNALLNDRHTFGDWAMLRRALCDLRLLERKTDGSAYWRSEETRVA
jgi:hypothetical protein